MGMRHRVSASCKIFALIAFINISLVTKCSGQTDTDTESPDYSAIFQQFLLQKIRDGEAWSNYDYESQFPQRARQEEIEEEDSSSVNTIIDESDEISSEESDEDAEEEDAETILNKAPYQMTSVDGGPSVEINLLQMSGSDLLTLEARVTSSSSSEEEGSLFRDDECVPEIYLVSGHTECRNLPESVSGKRLVTIHGTGEGSATVGAIWSELSGSCLAMLLRRECGETEEEEEEDDDGDTESLVVEVDTTEAPAEARYAAEESIVRTAGLGRAYSSLSLSNFNILSAASASSVFSVTKPTLTFGGAVPLNVVATKYDRFSTLPYLQLSGWTAADAFLLGLFMITGYFIYAYSTASLVDIEPLRRRFLNPAQLARVDAVNDGLSLILKTYLMSLSSPWRKIASNIDNNLLKRRKASKNKFITRADLELDDPLHGY